jgi:PAS domain S-box-containing protein
MTAAQKPSTDNDRSTDWTERERVAALKSYNILDTPVEVDFDEIAQLAAETLCVPIAVINLIAADRQWFKAEVGIGARELPLDVSICAHALLQNEFLVVPDTRSDERFACNPLVTAVDGLRFYAGALLRNPAGIPIGTLCVLDRQPRPDGVTAHQRRTLEVLARQVMAQLELRKIISQSDGRADDLRAEISQRAEIETALRSVEERYRLASNATNDAIWDWDFATDHVLWNESIETAYGHRISDIDPTGEWWISHIHADDRNRVSQSIHAAIDSDAINWSDEYRFERADGAYAPVLDRGFIIREPSGRPVRMIGAMLDMTERRQREIALNASNERFQAAVAAIDGYLWTNSADGEMRGPQPGWALLTGQGEEEYQGYGWANAVHPDDAQPTIAAWNAAVAKRSMFIFEHRVCCADGQWRRFSIRAVPMFDEDGCLREWVGIHTDVTQQREQEEALAANETRLRFLDDLSRAIAVASDADEVMAITTRMVAMHLDISNCAYADMHEDEDGFTIRGDWAAVGSLSITGHYKLADFGVLALERLHAGQPLVINDNAIEIAPEEAATFQAIGIAATICMPLVKAGRLTALMAIHDRVPHIWTPSELRLIASVAERSWAHIERVRATAALAELNASLEERVEERSRQLLVAEEALRQAHKMEAVGQLTGGIAHDFNNMLTGVIGSLDLLQHHMAAGRTDRVARYIDTAMTSAQRAAGLTQRLLAFSRRQSLDVKAVNIDDLARGMEELLQRTLGEGISLKVASTDGSWLARTDYNQLESALLNLAINARDAMPDGGILSIKTSNVRFEKRYSDSFGELDPGDYVALTVSDTGTGMSKDVLAKAFDPFFTTKPIGSGTGLGLSMIYGFARQSGGHVRIASMLEKGTTITLYLPRDEGNVVEAQPSTSAVQNAEPGECVLLVEDDPSVRLLVADVLNDLGYEVIQAADGVAAVTTAQSMSRIDLLITDVGLPGMNGRQLAEILRQSRPALKILFMTGYAEGAAIRGQFLAEGMEMITKPFAIDLLSTKIREMIEMRDATATEGLLTSR